MARKPRIHLTGGLYHVILRGNGGQPVFLSDEDRYRFYLLMQEGTCRFGYRVHAFCLMTNHIHLALQAGEIPLSRKNMGSGLEVDKLTDSGILSTWHTNLSLT